GNNGIGIDLATTSNIKTFTNGSGGFIGGNKGINLTAGSSIETFNNSGTIQGPEVGIQTNATINTFTNSGLINSPGNSRWSNGIWVSANSNIKTFTNTGSIQGFNSGVMVRERGTIDNLTNKGTIKSTGTIQPSTTILVSSGIYFYINTIKTLDNEGLISGIMGLNLVAATIDNLTNKGTIESTGGKNNLVAAINLMTSDGDPSYIKTFANEGVIKSNYQGILAEAGNKIDTLINKGTIEAGLNGISFYYYNDEISGNQVNLGNIILEKGSSIKAGNNGINIDGTSNKPITVSGSIEVKK
ncbi:autotransporter outer membrane beta-barrel domain-containing protein, partial [Campylobacter jejuni]|nr:autotransporter outer membrane beta-barrel domain-containing protein [Campylobacter jejuni]